MVSPELELEPSQLPSFLEFLPYILTLQVSLLYH